VKKKKENQEEAELRRRAEERLKKANRGSEDLAGVSPERMARLIHELEVHQTELLMQNDELRRIQAELEKARDRYSDLYDFAPVGYFTMSDKGIIAEVNLTGAAMIGMERSALIGNPFTRFVLRDDQDIFYKLRQHLLETETPHACEPRLVKKNGQAFYARMECMVVKNQDDDSRQIRAAVSDISERKHAHEFLKKTYDELERIVAERTRALTHVNVKLKREIEDHKRAEEQLKTTLESIGDGFFACDRDWRFVYVNPIAERLLSIRREEVLGKSHWEVFPFTLGTRLESEYRRAAAGEARDFENFYEPWGRWFHNRCFPRAGGGMSVYFQDITERKHSEAALKSSEEKYRALVDSTEDSIYLVDEDCNYLFMNSKHRNRIGLSSSDIDRLAYAAFHTKEETASFRDMVGKVFETGSPFSYAYQSKREGNYFVRTLSPVMEGENVKAVSVVSKDITAQKQAEREAYHNRLQLAHLERIATLGELAASLAHELSQPLTAILSNAQAAVRLIQSTPPEINEVRAIIQDIIEDDRRAGEFIQHLRAFFKRGELDKKALDINGVVNDVVSLFKSEAVLRDILIETAPDIKLPAVLANEIHVQQVILNLVLNASESMLEVNDRPKRAVITTMRENASFLKIGVCDFGRGIDPANHAAIFKPYFTTKKDGMGMGLAICRSIVQAHGGKIWAENNPDQGATFYFTLPIADERRP
jgi:PAS domain S-box-containing protein